VIDEKQGKPGRNGRREGGREGEVDNKTHHHRSLHGKSLALPVDLPRPLLPSLPPSLLLLLLLLLLLIIHPRVERRGGVGGRRKGGGEEGGGGRERGRGGPPELQLGTLRGVDRVLGWEGGREGGRKG